MNNLEELQSRRNRLNKIVNQVENLSSGEIHTGYMTLSIPTDLRETVLKARRIVIDQAKLELKVCEDKLLAIEELLK